MSKDTIKVPAPKGLISPDRAKELDQAFNDRHKLISSSILKRPDNRSTWYAIEEIEQFLAYAKQEASDLGYTLDGIRIYEGAYPEEKDQPGYTTMFIVPTGTCHKKEKTLLKSSSEGGSGDVPGGSGLNLGHAGNPPEAHYPQ